jgi:DNA topoisomerase-1
MEESAQRAARHGLHYVEVEELCLVRQKGGRGFRYCDAKGRIIRKAAALDRIRTLAIPPAWVEVQIAAHPKAHIQAVGRDSEGRLQYLYHTNWTAVRDKVKAERLFRFGQALPKIRTQLEKDLNRRKTDRRYAAALAARLIDRALLRAGHYVADSVDAARGATTLLNRDVQLNGTEVTLNFTGKGGKVIKKTVRDAALPVRLRRLKRLGKKRLFAFKDDKGRCCYLSARELNDYLREAAGAPVTAKDFRTFAASSLALAALCTAEWPPSPSARKRLVAEVMRATSKKLTNTPAVARSSYVHPLVVEAFEAEQLRPNILQGAARQGLSHAETALMRFLEDALQPPQPVANRKGTRSSAPALRRTATHAGRRKERGRWARTASRRSGHSSGAPASA